MPLSTVGAAVQLLAPTVERYILRAVRQTSSILAHIVHTPAEKELTHSRKRDSADSDRRKLHFTRVCLAQQLAPVVAPRRRL